jgi:plastocyanin
MIDKRIVRIFLLLLALVLVACGGNDPEVNTPTAQPETETTDEEAAGETPEVIEETPEVIAEETPEVIAVPTETPAPTPTAVPVPRVGILRFSDTETVRGGAFRLQIEDVEPAPAGSHYELVLLSDDGETLSLGDFVVEGGAVDFEGTADENLLGNYSSAIIVVRPNEGEAEIADLDVAFSGVTPLNSLAYVRNLVYEFGGNEDSQAFLPAAEEQNAIAIEHATLLLDALAVDNLGEAKLHAEHVVNILDGEDGEHYGDLDGDGRAQNPGDGVGVRVYLEGAREHAGLAAEADGATDEVTLHSGHVVIAAENALGWVDEAIDAAEHVITADTPAEAMPFADELGQLTADITAGRDLNGDNYAAPAPGEGAIATAYEHAVFMGGFEIFAGEGGPPITADAGGSQEVVIDMLDFTYSELSLTIEAGTTVTWVNVGAVQHSATASDGSFDTGLIDPNGEASFTFDAAGSFPYYCTLHGTADGGGMAANITVVADTGIVPAPTVAAEAEEVTVDALDFSFDPVVLTVEAGTTVTWINVGAVQHSATASDGSWDTGLFDAGAEASLTFDEVGTFPYYCILHGTATGAGMAGEVQVIAKP